MARREARVAASVLAIGVLLGGSVSATGGGASATVAPPRDDDRDLDRVRVQAVDRAASSEQASRRVSALSTRERAAAVVMGHIPSTDPAVLRDYMARTGIGGFILMGANIPGSESALRDVTSALTIDPALPPLISIDQEGGDVSRLPWDDFPSSLDLQGADPTAVQAAFAGRGALVMRAGIGVNFGIVADVTDDRSMFIHRRALGTTPDAAAAAVSAAVTGEGVLAASTVKHFPGHGAAPGDSHRGIPSTDMPLAEWRASDALPFAAGVDAGAPLLMFGHLAYTAVDAAPASLSSAWHAIARDELGFDGIAVTDDLGMLQASGVAAYADPVANAVAALAAGNDIVLSIMFTDADSAARIVDGIVAAVESGVLPPARLEEAATRVTDLRLDLAARGRGLVPCADCAPAP